MPASLIAALVFTVILLVITAYFLMGSVPLLVLEHETSLDAKFVRGFFNTYYLAAVPAAGATAVSYAIAGKAVFAAGALFFALLGWQLRRTVLAKMDMLRSQIQGGEQAAISGFRRLHASAIAANLGQLVTMVWALVSLSAQLK
jgi:hypothetical protein